MAHTHNHYSRQELERDLAIAKSLQFAMNLQRRYDFDFTEQDDMDLRKLANDQQKQIGATIHMCLPSLKRSDD